jgi:alanyl-tRNA synthetase
MSALADAYRLDYFEREGFERTACDACGCHFWTRDPDRSTCGEPPCDDYAFIDDPGFDETHTLESMRDAFLDFFADRGHEPIDPYPVAANRWRDDVLLTQASIYDFQPHVTTGETPPPANPLAVSQPCIRMGDIDNVGRTGRHTMAFEMMGHHAFNADEGTDYAYEGEVYWTEACVEYCIELLREVGADVDDVTLIEDPWVGGGNAGPAFEVIYRGLELATLVFMQYEQVPDGADVDRDGIHPDAVEMKDGNDYVPMDRRIIDTGYGLERWVWMSQGTPTVYEAIYPDLIDDLRADAGLDHDADDRDLVRRAAVLAGHMDLDEVESIAAARRTIADKLDVPAERLQSLLEPLEAIYAIADHTRALAYMLGDEIVPSSSGTGYLARMVLRRTSRLADEADIDTPLADLVDRQAERLGYDNRDTIRAMVETEVEQYRETLERGGRRVESIAREYAERDDPIPVEELIELYDSHGIQPDTVERIAAEHGARVDVPDDFYSRVADRHGGGTDEAGGGAVADRLADLPETEQLYYEDQEDTTFEAEVLDVFEHESPDTPAAEPGSEPRYDVVLDATLFYPKGGGQPADRGTLAATDTDTTANVLDVHERDGVVLHRTDAPIEPGSTVTGRIDAERRRKLMRHHTATHVIGAAARAVLGDHIRQAGAQKHTDGARLDVRHYERVDREAEREIERVANELVRANLPVEQEWPDRNAAEAEYGFDLYQGGVPPGEHIRLIHVGDRDTQACGGTHVSRTGDIGAIVLTRTERVQDGVERLEFAAGDAAIDAVQDTTDALNAAAATFDVDPADVPATAERFFDEWKERGKRVDRLKEELAAARAAASDDGREVELDGATAIVRRLDGDADDLRATANAIADEGDVAVLGGDTGGSATVVVAVPDGVPVNAGQVVGALAERVGGGGGGPPDFAQGGGPDVDALDDALDDVDDLLRATLDAEA